MPKVLRYLPKDEAPSAKANESPGTVHDVLIFFITGNPGIVDYYEPFLCALGSLVQDGDRSNEGRTRTHVYGRGLRGFEEGDHAAFSAKNPPLDVEAQIVDTLKFLLDLRDETSDGRGRAFDKVILMGHSVGAYIVLEIFHRLLHDPEKPKLNLTAGILLFPTVTHLLQSPSGQRVDRLRSLPGGSFVAARIHQLASALLWPWPTSMLSWFVSSALGMPPHATQATTQFLRSSDAVWQAIHLGQDELRVISDDKWAEELWEIEEDVAQQQQQQQQQQQHADGDVPKFFFYFGAHDHWVANEQRAKFIEAREEHARREGPRHKRGRTRIVVDEDDIPHAFCIHDSEQVAEKVAKWIQEISGQS